MSSFLLSMIGLIIAFSLNAQDPHFSQFYASPLNLNPALTGIIDGQYRFHAIYRDQWRSLGVPYKTFSASADFRYHIVDQDFYTFGVKFVNDTAGDSGFRQTSGHLSAAYMKQVSGGTSDHFLIGGVQIGLAQNTMEWGSLWFGRQFDFTTLSENLTLDSGEPGILTNTGRTEMYMDLGAGLAWFASWGERRSMIMGISYAHMNQADVSFLNDDRVKLESRISLHANGELDLNPILSLMPGILYQTQGSHHELVLGSNFRYLQPNVSATGLRVGAWLRFVSSRNDYGVDAVILTAMYEFDRMLLGISYDVTLSSLAEANSRQGGLEVSLSYIFPYTQRKYSINCPKL